MIFILTIFEKLLPITFFISRAAFSFYVSRKLPKCEEEFNMGGIICILHTNNMCDSDDLRINYQDKSSLLLEENLPRKDPIFLFNIWLEEVLKHPDIPEPNAMCLATATKDGKPSARFMLLKSAGNEGFKFFTNYESRKGDELEENPHAAVVVYWKKLNRQIRIEGHVIKMSQEESEKYFEKRPRENQIGTWSSYQSRLVTSRSALTENEKRLSETYKNGAKVPYPYFWGGYIIKPHTMEFWQGQTDRIHDRIRFRRPRRGEIIDGLFVHEGENGWIYERLAP